MRRYSPPYHSPPRRGYGGRPRSPPRRGHGSHGSLLVRNIPLDCRPEELRIPFERFGLVRDVYLPKDYYTGEISVVVAAETRKRPEDMRRKARLGGPAGYGGRRPSYQGYSRSRSRSRSPRYPSGLRGRHRSRSFSPAPRGRSDYSISPDRRHLVDGPRYPRDHLQDQHLVHNRRSYSPGYVDVADQNVNNYGKKTEREAVEGLSHWRSPPPPGAGRASRSPSGSRSRSADISPRHGR